MQQSLPVPILAELFDTLPVGIIAVDRTGTVVIFNRSEEVFSRRKREDILGRPFFTEVAPCMNVKELAGEFFAKIGHGSFEARTECRFPFPFVAEPRDVIVTMRSFDSNGEPYASFVIEDVSLQRSVDRMKESLAALLVHDLKNPLAVIATNLSFLEEHETLEASEDAREAVADSIEATTRLNRMVLNLLDITRLESSHVPLRKQTIIAKKLLDAIARANRSAAEPRLTIEVDADAAMTLYADEDIVRRALENLVENALRHSRTRIVLRARELPKTIVIEVEDDGLGVPADLRTQVFERYASRSGTRGNVGLGLALVRLAARVHGGEADLLSVDGEGVRFRMTILR